MLGSPRAVQGERDRARAEVKRLGGVWSEERARREACERDLGDGHPRNHARTRLPCEVSVSHGPGLAVAAGREGSAFCSAERHPLARLLAEAARQDASTAKAKRDAALERLSAAQAEIDDKGGLLADVEQQITDLEGTVQQTAQVTRAVLLLAY